MIMLYYNEGNWSPVLVCDVCQQRITRRHTGMAVGGVLPNDGNPELEPLLHAHKGECLDEAERRLGKGSAVGTDELAFHLACLVHNVGLTPEQLSRSRASYDEMGF